MVMAAMDKNWNMFLDETQSWQHRRRLRFFWLPSSESVGRHNHFLKTIGAMRGARVTR
jgi:hypothetical protein